MHQIKKRGFLLQLESIEWEMIVANDTLFLMDFQGSGDNDSAWTPRSQGSGIGSRSNSSQIRSKIDRDDEGYGERHHSKHDKNSDWGRNKRSSSKPPKSGSSQRLLGSKSQTKVRKYDQDLYRMQNHVQAPSDLNVWNISKSFFRPIPPTEKFERIFNGPKQHPYFADQDAAEENWKAIVKNLAQKITEKNPAVKIRIPSLLSQQRTSLSMSTSSPKFDAFKTESLSQKNENMFRRLLCCFVPSPRTKEEQEDEKENKIQKAAEVQNESYIKAPHALPPYIEHHKYLSLDFETRLLCELESVGLVKQNIEYVEEKDPFQIDLSAVTSELDNVQNSLQQIKSNLLAQLPNYRKEQKQHSVNIDIFKACMREKVDGPIMPARKKRKQ